MPQTRRIDIVLFDLDDTLHDDTYAFSSAAEEVAREVAAEHGIDALAHTAAYITEAEGFWHRLSPEDLKVKLSSIRAGHVARRHVKNPRSRASASIDEDLARRSAERCNTYPVPYFRSFPDAVRSLYERCAARGVKLRASLQVGNLSETHREKIAVLRLSEFFDAIFLAVEVGM